MKRLLPLLALPLLVAAAPAKGPSFACKGKLSPTERTICASPELSAWDRAMARVHAVIGGPTGLPSEQQRAWLAERNACGSRRACLLAAYRDWPGFGLRASGVGQELQRQGTEKVDPATLEIMPIYGDWYYFAIEAMHIRDAAEGSVHVGSYSGVVALPGGKGRWDELPGDPNACRFTLVRHGPRHWSIEQPVAESQCGGLNVYFDGDYRPF